MQLDKLDLKVIFETYPSIFFLRVFSQTKC